MPYRIEKQISQCNALFVWSPIIKIIRKLYAGDKTIDTKVISRGQDDESYMRGTKR